MTRKRMTLVVEKAHDHIVTHHENKEEFVYSLESKELSDHLANKLRRETLGSTLNLLDGEQFEYHLMEIMMIEDNTNGSYFLDAGNHEIYITIEDI